jgi:murein DD-endopeptidase MepM/ murein hydrolase activator NlpD
MKKVLYTLFMILIMNSCGHVTSGQYVQIRSKDTVKSLAKEFKIPEWQIKESNTGKSFKTGEWVFIPLNRGLMHEIKRRSPAASTMSYIGTNDFMWPVPSSKRITSEYGKRWGRRHEGIDISGRRGSHIVATQDGVVVYSGNEMGGYGNITVIAHPGGFFSIYAHADRNYTSKGQKVYRGQVIAALGSTGRSTGNHLHFEIRRNSKAINPKKFVSAN